MDLFVVITTIHKPTESSRALASRISGHGKMLIVGDTKGPDQYNLEGCELLTLEIQKSLGVRLEALLPTNSYSRKNLGYLVAIGQGAACIYETDDDNAPLPSWIIRSRVVEAKRITNSGPWFNIYGAYSPLRIWPRGFPLEHVLERAVVPSTACEKINAPIQQGLANGAPDVDAIWRLTVGDNVTFGVGESLLLTPGIWCPFNSQSTWWWPEAFPLLYLPSFCTFRMTDIWRSFVAQRCLWELGLGLVFHAAEVAHERNSHNLIKDFEDEIPGYLNNTDIVKTLADLQLAPGAYEMGANLHRCYAQLVTEGYFPQAEIPLVKAWLEDLDNPLKPD